METTQTVTHGTDDAIRESMVSRFSKIPGVGQTKARILYDAGFTSIESLRRASEKDFAEINGISPSFARHIKREAMKLPKDLEKDKGPTGSVTIKADGVEIRPKGEEARDKAQTDVEARPKGIRDGREARPGRGAAVGADDGSSGIFKKFLKGFTGKEGPAPDKTAKPDEKAPVSIRAVEEKPDSTKKEGEAGKAKPKEDLGPDE